ncbi:MAG: hypothetical protein CM15mP25_5060 [Gammaproteobacteria bacterium]|nr:MAG: hypothetical protein CM15mP25_5060 [Gammaproteobacteria bacterium]
MKACPDGVDVFFDNVGGQTLEAVISNMNHRGRCAMRRISGVWRDTSRPNNLFELITKSSGRGFMTHFRHDRYEKPGALSHGCATASFSRPSIASRGSRTWQGLRDLFAGENFGKTIVAL